MLVDRLRRSLSAFKRLFFAFGLFGIVVWPTTGWLGYTLLDRDISHLEGLHVAPSLLIGRDFVNVWHGGSVAREKDTQGLYDRAEYRRSLREAAGVGGIYAFSYPPHMALLAIPFGMIGYVPALLLWSLGGLALFWHAARPWLHDVGLPGWSVLFLSGTTVNLWAGHFGFLIGALALYGWRGVPRGGWHGALAFAVMSVKPHMGILVPVILALKREWTSIARISLCIAVLVALATAVLGVQAWVDWFGSTLTFQASLIDDEAQLGYSFMMPTVGRMLMAVSDDQGLQLFGQFAFGLYAIAIIVWAHRGGVALRDLGLLSFAATALLLPYSFTYDLVAQSLTALLFACRWPTRCHAPDKLIYGAAFLVPLVQMPLAREGIWVSPLALAAMLGLAGWRLVGDQRRAAA